MSMRELTTDECVELLSTVGVGRVALCLDEGPTIYPVNFVVAGLAIVFRTAVYSTLGGAIVKRPPLAFEVDEIDHERRRAWSVVARGIAEPLDDPEELDALDPSKRLVPWVQGSRNLVVRLAWRSLEGRRVGD